LSFDFEKPIDEVEKRLEEARRAERAGQDGAADVVADLERELERVRVEVYEGLTPWQRVQVARHKDRPRALDFIEALTTEFTEIHGDRAFGDDHSVVCGFARFEGRPVAVVGQQKGRDTRENVARNFGMMHPEGYRKALRLMRLADKFKMPVLVFIDTPGAYPGIGAEERGQAEAIARNIQEMMGVRTPIVALVIGEGASGGALGVGLADRVLMLENAWYCVISPEGCAAILWKDAAEAARAAEALKLTAPDLLGLGVIDEIVPEPPGGAHRQPEAAFENARAALARHLAELRKLRGAKLLDARFRKYRGMGAFREA